MVLPALGEEVPLPRIKEICAFYGLHDLWQKIERAPPLRPFKAMGAPVGSMTGRASASTRPDSFTT
jgi:hypothetical protein